MKLIFTFLLEDDSLLKKEFDFDEILLRDNKNKDKHKISLLKEFKDSKDSLDFEEKAEKYFNEYLDQEDYNDVPGFINNPGIDVNIDNVKDETPKEKSNINTFIFNKEYIDIFQYIFDDDNVKKIKGIYCPLVSLDQPIMYNSKGKLIWSNKMRQKLNFELDKYFLKK